MTSIAVPEKPTAAVQLPEQVTRRSISEPQWRTLCNNLYPGANTNSVLMVWDYCVARKLDPLKKPCHIVPMEVKDAKTGKYEWRDVVMPGIYELRTTAQRTGKYMGHSAPEFGPDVDFRGLTAPEWAAWTVYRLATNGERIEFPVRVYFREVVATKKDGKANSRWERAPIQMLTKCLEAAGLREAFPDELGGEQTAEEMDGQRAIDAVVVEEPKGQALVKPEKFDDWLQDMSLVPEQGLTALEKAWAGSKPEFREYLNTTDAEAFEAWKAKAIQADAATEAQE